jgi:hypothetical protein
MEEIILIKESVATTALEEGWDKEKQDEMFHEAVAEAIKSTVSNRKNHKKNGI